jgi:hypothetical protein
MKSSRCRDDGEMYGKGLALTLACTSPLFLQPAARFAHFSAAGRILVVHFAGILAAPLIRAVHSGAFLAGRRTRAVHFPSFPAASRALRPIPCRGTISCKDLREVHVERLAGCPFRRALPPFSCTQACTSPVSLHEFASMQGFGGSARHRAGIEEKCTAARLPPAQGGRLQPSGGNLSHRTPSRCPPSEAAHPLGGRSPMRKAVCKARSGPENRAARNNATASELAISPY